MDSIQITEDSKVLFNAPVSTPEYTPPEAITIVSKKYYNKRLGYFFVRSSSL